MIHLTLVKIFKRHPIGILIGLFIILIVQLVIILGGLICDNNSNSFQIKTNQDLPIIYVVTPTYSRYVQKAELIRLSHTLMLVPNIHWIIVEDSEWLTGLVSKFVFKLKNEFNFHLITQLHASTPEKYKLKHGDPSWRYPKGVWQRNRALTWIRENYHDLDPDGVVYFADDDNTYDLALFNEMRYTKKVSVWPVGLVGGLLVERPIVHPIEHDKIESFNSMWEAKRPFPLDMAGFAISLHLLISTPDASFSDSVKIGYIESHFLNQLVSSWDELEPRADKCRKVLVWHTRTREPVLHEEKKLKNASISDIEW